MKTITNKSNFVIVVTNGFVSKEIPIHGQEIIQDDEINGNYTLNNIVCFVRMKRVEILSLFCFRRNFRENRL